MTVTVSNRTAAVAAAWVREPTSRIATVSQIWAGAPRGGTRGAAEPTAPTYRTAIGALVAGSVAGWVYESDENFQLTSSFRATYYLPTFVSFTTSIPEPVPAAILLFAIPMMALKRR